MFEVSILEPRLLLATHPLTSIPALNSYPSAYAQLYLDFSGEPAHSWNGSNVPATPAFTEDADATTFSDQELADIQQIWSRVAEKFSLFNVNVTTVRPADFNPMHALHMVIGGDGAWAGAEPFGISNIGCFYGTSGTDSYVFSAILNQSQYNGTNKPAYIAEAIAHEAGHAFGLNHQSLYSGTTLISEYNSGNSQTAPIMGMSYGAARGLWWYGTTDISSTNYQGDLGRIARPAFNFGYRPDDHGNTPATASPFTVSGTTLSGSGVVETCPWTDSTKTAVISDEDYFSFSTMAGTVNFTVNVAPYGPMLNAIVELRDGNNNLIATGTGPGLGKTLSANLATGTYYLVVRGDNTYGDLGQYTVSGTIPANIPLPVANAGGPYTMPEGASIKLDGSASTGTGLTYAWDLDGNGIFGQTGSAALCGDETGMSPTFIPNHTGLFNISLRTTDIAGNTSTVTSTVYVANVAPSPTITNLPAGNTSPEETTLNLGVNPGDPVTFDTFTYAWTVTRSGSTFATGSSANFSFTPDAPGIYNVLVTVTDSDGATGNASTSITATHVSYRVVGFMPTASGFDVQLNRPANLGLLNLYTTKSVALLPDVTLVGSTTGSIHGSLVWDSTTQTAHFVKTGSPLPPDVYTATLASRPDGWVDTRGEQLDGDANGNPGGDYVAKFTITASSARVVSLNDFTRGPGQAVNLPATGTGIPIQISDGTGVSSVQLTLSYDPSMLTINNVTAPAAWTVNTTGSTPGRLMVTASGPALASGVAGLLTLNAAVPGTAQYGASELLRISSLQINSGAIAATSADTVHKVVFLGDATGDRSYSALDAANISRVAMGLDTGFAALPLTDPVIVADINSDGILSSADAVLVARKSAFLTVPQLADLPAGNVPATQTGLIDPNITIGTGTGAPGNFVDVTVNITSPVTLEGANLAISYNTSLLTLIDSNVVLGSLPDGWILVSNTDNSSGIVQLSLFSGNPLPIGTNTLADLKFQISGTAPSMSSPVSLLTSPVDSSRLNEGQLPLTTVPGAVVINPTQPALTLGSSVLTLLSPSSFGTISIEAGGRLNIAKGGTNLLQMASIVIHPGGVLDLADNDMVMADPDASGFATLRQYLADGRIITSVTQPTPGHFATLALADNRMIHQSTWDGATINNGTNFSQILIKHTWVGDTNLDGVVTQEDYLNIIANMGRPGQWITGDLNGDGIVSADDLAMVSSNLGAGLITAPGPQLQTNQASGVVPATGLTTTTSPQLSSNSSMAPTTAALVKPIVKPASKAIVKPAAKPVPKIPPKATVKKQPQSNVKPLPHPVLHRLVKPLPRTGVFRK